MPSPIRLLGTLRGIFPYRRTEPTGEVPVNGRWRLDRWYPIRFAARPMDETAFFAALLTSLGAHRHDV